MTDDTPQDQTDSIDFERRRLLQTGAVALGGIALSETAGAVDVGGNCEQAMPDVTIINDDDRERSVSLGAAAGLSLQRTVTAGPGESTTIESLAVPTGSQRIKATVDDGTDVVRSLSELEPERFRHGFEIRVTSDDITVRKLHVDLPPQEYTTMRRRCTNG